MCLGTYIHANVCMYVGMHKHTYVNMIFPFGLSKWEQFQQGLDHKILDIPIQRNSRDHIRAYRLRMEKS